MAYSQVHCNGLSGSRPWAEQIPATMPWAMHEPSLMRFTGSAQQSAIGSSNPIQAGHFAAALHVMPPFAQTNPFPTPVLASPDLASPDPCSSQTATQWELFHKLASPTMSQRNPCLKR